MTKKLKKRTIPKEIGGVKIPKAVRRSAMDFLASQDGRAVMTEALAAAGAALAGSQAKKGSATRKALDAHSASELTASARQAAGGVSSSVSAVGYALAAAARTFADSLHSGKAVADAKAAWPEEPEVTPTRPVKRRGGDEAAQTH